MRTVHKYEVPRTGFVSLPKDHQLLSFQEQRGCLVVWALVDPDSPKIIRRFLVVLTGEPVGVPRGAHLATVQMTPQFVLHIFESPAVPK